MQLRIVVAALLFSLAAFPVFADGVFVEAGTGLLYSTGTNATLARYQHDTSRLFGLESFYEASYASWSGLDHNEAIGFARGLRWEYERNVSLTADMGAAHITRTTGHLGTPFQFVFRFSWDKRFGPADLSVGWIHYSNGKFIFHWAGTNDSENFLTLSLGMFF